MVCFRSDYLLEISVQNHSSNVLRRLIGRKDDVATSEQASVVQTLPIAEQIGRTKVQRRAEQVRAVVLYLENGLEHSIVGQRTTRDTCQCQPCIDHSDHNLTC